MSNRKRESKIDKINIGIVGCGWIVEFAHLPALQKIKDVTVKAVFDINIESARLISKKFSIQYVFDKFEDFIDCGLDGIIIATPNSTHVSYTMEALQRNVGVLCEKPVALKSSEVEEIIKICKEKNVIYIPGFVNRWREDIQKMYSVLQEGKIGEIKSVSAGWLRKSGIPRPGTWFTSRRFSGGGVLTDLGSHIIDICLMIIGDRKLYDTTLLTSVCDQENIEQKCAAEWFRSNDNNSHYEMDVEKTAIANARYEDGVKLSVKLSWMAPIKSDCTYFRVHGINGDIELKTLFGFSSDRLWKEDSLKICADGKEEVIYFDMSENKSRVAFGKMLSYFCNSLRTGSVLSVNCYDAFKSVALIEKLYNTEIQDEKKFFKLYRRIKWKSFI